MGHWMDPQRKSNLVHFSRKNLTSGGTIKVLIFPLTDLLTYVQNILQSSFVGPFDTVGVTHLPTMSTPQSGHNYTVQSIHGNFSCQSFNQGMNTGKQRNE